MEIKKGCEYMERYTNKILPSVYDESLSYYEELLRIIKRMDILDEDMREEFSKSLIEFFNKIMPSAIYERENETINLAFEITTTNDRHTFVASENAMKIGE